MQALGETSAADSTDGELLERYVRSADEAAFAEIVRRHSPLVLAVTRRRIGSSGFAEDAAQQVFIALSRRARQLREIPCLGAWLQKAAVYESATILRREARHRRRALHSRELGPSHDSAAQEADLDLALAALAAPDRQILLLHHFEKLRYEQIAQRLGITAAAAQRRGHRALERLARLLKGGAKDEASCAMWLAAGLVPRGTEVSGSFLSRTVTLKKPTAFTLPWVPVLASVLVGGAAVAVSLKEADSTPTLASPAPVGAPPRAEARKLRPALADEQLSDELREFITRAKADSKDAWEWVKARPDGPGSFLNPAVRHLADRDLAAAERLLDVVQGGGVRAAVIAGIFSSRAEGNFESAVVWIDSFPAGDDRRVTIYHGSADFPRPDENDYDYMGALKIARSREVREWLIREVYQRSRRFDESVIEKLADELQGEERRLALSCVASLRLQRNDPTGFDLLEEIQAGDEQLIYFPSGLDLREFEPLCNWIAERNDGVDRSNTIRTLWIQWSHGDAAAAAAWARKTNNKGGFGPFGIPFSPSDPVTKRFMEEP